MNTIENAYINALLADATYAVKLNGSGNVTADNLREDLSRSMTPALANYIADKFTVVSHIDTGDYIGSGFDATVWKENSTGKLYVSMRGTSGVQDFLTDVELAFTGNAGQQVIDMVNWWLKITTPVGQQASQIGNAVDATGLVSSASSVPGNGLVTAADLARGIEVNGHSLGGYLATAFTRLFGNQANITHTSTFNSAGFALGSESAFINLHNLIHPSFGLGTFPDSSKQTNYFAENGLNVATNEFWFNQQGTRVEISNELDSFQPGNHSMYKLTDALALGAAMEKLDVTFTMPKLNALLNAGSSSTAGSIEGLLDSLRRALLGVGITPTRIGDAKDSAESRKDYHEKLRELQGADVFRSLKEKLVIKLASADALRAAARNNFGALVALQDLSAIVISGRDAAAEALLATAWQNNRASEYAAWTADKGVPTPTSFTDKWIEDRAAMVGYVVQLNQLDSTSPLSVPGAQGRHFKDLQSGIEVDIGLPNNVVEKRQTLFGGDNNEAITGKGFSDHLYGGAGIDTLAGLGGDDYIEGNAGDDILNGGNGNDTLVGGAGTDVYQFGSGWGVDRVIDSDGLGSIEFNGQPLTGGELAGTNAWISTDKQWRYALTEQDDLIITHTSEPGRIIVQGWTRMKGLQNTPLGLNLTEAVSPQQPSPLPQIPMYALQGGYFVPGGPQLPGGTWQIQSDGSIAGMLPIYDSNDLMVGGQNKSNGLYERVTGVEIGSDGNQRYTMALTGAVSLWGLGGNDFMSGEQYDDYLDGGDGDDIIWGGAGSDNIRGGAGNDIIVTNMAANYMAFVENSVSPGYTRGADTVFTYLGGQANYLGRWWVEKSEDGLSLKIPRAYLKNPEGGETYWAEGENDIDVVDAGDGDDYVWGGRGADYLMGGAGVDHLAGLGGGDVILGGEGKDLIFGDEWAGMRLAAVYDTDRESGYVKDMPLDDALKSPALHGNDVIDAGAGDDEVWGDGGDDVVFGGTGNDLLIGDALPDQLPIEYHGKDNLDGGDGDDVLIGMSNDDVLLGGAGNDELQGDYGDLAGQFHGDDVLDGGEGNDHLFGQGGSDTLYGGEGDDIIESDSSPLKLAGEFHGNDYVDGGDGNDNIAGGGGDDVMYGGAGDDWISGEDETEVNSISTLIGNDIISGGTGNDVLVGGNGDDQLSGDEGDDWLYGGTGDDWLHGGAGRNELKGGLGDDSYIVTSDGTHLISDAEGNNLIRGLEGLTPGATLQGDLVLFSGTRTVVITDGLKAGFSGSVVVGEEQMSIGDYVLEYMLDPLSVVGHTDNQNLSGGRGEDEFFAYGANAVVRGGKGGDHIALHNTGGHVKLDRGDGRDRVVLAPLPSPEATANNRVSVQLGEGITASDVSFEYDAMANVLRLRYSPEEDDVLEVTYQGLVPPSVVDAPPISEVRLADGTSLGFDFVPQKAEEDTEYSYQLSHDIFSSVGGNTQVSAKLTNGQPLPSWLNFDPITLTFSGTPGNENVGGLSVLVQATKGNVELKHSFALLIRNVNDAPKAGAVLPAFFGDENQTWVYDLPEGTFTDVDAGDSLRYAARLADGTPLPSWIIIDSDTGQLRYSGGRALATRLSLIITATDMAGASTEQSLDLTVRSMLDSQAILGTPGNDILRGTAGNDLLIGGKGNDVLDGGAGKDILIGGNSDGRSSHLGEGDDTYLFGRGDGNDEIWSGRSQSLSSLQFKSGIRPEDVNIRRGAGSITVWGNDGSWRLVPDSVVFTIIDTGETITIPNFHTAYGLGSGRVDFIKFTDFPEVNWDAETVSRLALQGSIGNDEIRAYTTDDVIRGNSGRDRLWGQWGNDAFHFGKYDGRDDVYEFSNEGVDKIVFDPGIGPADVAIVRTLDQISFYPGGMLVIRVLAGNTEITVPNFFQSSAESGIETIEFANGVIWDKNYILANAQGMSAIANEFSGLPGDDNYIIDHPHDIIVEQTSAGVDSVASSVTYILPENLENMTLTGVLSINATGNSERNVLVGNIGDNVLDWGGGGHDSLQGGLGDDIYKIMAPNESRYYWSDDKDFLALKVDILEEHNEGVDQLRTNAFYAVLPDNIENLIISSFIAPSINFTLAEKPIARYFGNSGDNTIDVSSVNSGFIPIELDGGAGNDVLMGSINGSDDWAAYGAANGGVSVSLADNIAQNTLAAGWDTLKNIENLRGSSHADVLHGNDGQNSIDGGVGADYMVGGGGDDNYFIDDLGDFVIEDVGGGLDTVYISGLTNYVLPDNIENADFAVNGGVTSLHVNGNEEDNQIIVRSSYGRSVLINGMGGNDWLKSTHSAQMYGGDGEDWLIGSIGNDVFFGGRGNDNYEIDGFLAGQDIIKADADALEPSEINVLHLTNVDLEQLTFRRQANDLRIRTGGSSYVLVEKFFDSTGNIGESNPLQFLRLVGGSSGEQILDVSQILAMVHDNQAPVLQEQFESVQAYSGQSFSWAMPYGAFTDDGDILTYSAELENGSALPSWLSFNTSNGRINGGVNVNSSINLSVRITATDEEGLSTSAILKIAVQSNNQVLEGTGDNDVLIAGLGNDFLYGYSGQDELQGKGGDDYLEGGLGDDVLFGDEGNDTMIGGKGNDLISAGTGNDIFEFSSGDGQDTIDASDLKTAVDIIKIHGLSASQVTLVKAAEHLYVQMPNNDQILVYNYFSANTVINGRAADSKIDQIVFDNGDVWNQTKIQQVINASSPTAPPSTYSYNQTMPTSQSNFTITGNATYNIKGNNSANIITGNDGANVLNGSGGNDTLRGGKGADTYLLENGTGTDTIIENDTTAGVIDILQWGSGITNEKLWFRKVVNNLEVSVIGTSNKAIVKDWYSGSANHVEQIWAGGKMLSDTKVVSLVNAMASFAVPASGQTTLPSNYQAALNPVIAASWQ